MRRRVSEVGIRRNLSEVVAVRPPTGRAGLGERNRRLRFVSTFCSECSLARAGVDHFCAAPLEHFLLHLRFSVA